MADSPKPLSQDDIDALVNQVLGLSSPAATPTASLNATPPTALPNGTLDQDTVDALINQAQAMPDSVPVAPAEPPVPTGALGQDDIDALINQVQQSTPAPSKPPAAMTGALDQDAIDALINLAPAAANKPTTAKIKPPTTRAQRETSISQVLDSVQDAAKAKAHASDAPADPAGGPLGQDDIDRLLAELGGSTTRSIRAKSEQQSVPTTAVAEAARSQQPGTTSSSAGNVTVEAPMVAVPAGPNSPTLALSAEDLDALVDRQVGVSSDHQEAPMIDQSDIDALVKQLANATGAPDTKRISDALAKHEGEIDKLLEQAGDANSTMDAIPMSGAANGSANTRPGATAVLTVPVMGPAELKGTRWLLAAAVLFLAMCATTLGMVVNAINGLSQELKTQHQTTLTPSNSFADDYKAAIAQLSAPDTGEVAKGVLFMSRLKTRHPGHEAEFALALGRHFRAKGANRQAAEEFAALAETGNGQFDDPRIYLDYAACLSELGDVQAAARQIYLLLANEDSYLSQRDHNGLTRPADEVTRNQQAVQDAYLTLGRMLATASQQDSSRATASHATTHDTHADAHEPAAKPAMETHGNSHGGH
jgi:hypothetical protein